MAVSYTCPNPECGATLKTANRIAIGKVVKCPKCAKSFTPEPAEQEIATPAAGTFKFADDGKKPTPPPPTPSKAHPQDDDDEDAESIKKGYGVVKETDQEAEEAKKNKPKFTEVQDKFKKSARGPAIAMLVMPANLLTAEGLLTAAAGIFLFVVGMWPLVFNDAPPGDEETEEAILTMILGLVSFGWGGLICFGASRMQELGSYTWAIAGAVAGIFPLLVGIFAVIVLQNPKVKAGFEESEGGPDDEDEDEELNSKKSNRDEDEEEDEEDEDEEDEDED